MASFLGSTSWVNLSFSQSPVFSSEQQVSPSSTHPSHYAIVMINYNIEHLLSARHRAQYWHVLCIVSLLARGFHVVVLPSSHFTDGGLKLRECK